MPEIEVRSSRRNQLIDITSQISETVPEDIDSGICNLFCMHTTAGLTVNENADPDVVHDILESLERAAPATADFYKHAEGNSDAHMKSSLMGASLTVPVLDGKLLLGTWQGIYFCEFDGPRTRSVNVNFIAAN